MKETFCYNVESIFDDQRTEKKQFKNQNQLQNNRMLNNSTK